MTSPLLHLALDLKSRGDFQGALHQLQELVSKDADCAQAWFEICDLGIKTKNYTLAAMAGTRAAELAPGDLASRVACGLALDLNDREQDAVRHFEAAVRLKPDFMEAWSMLGFTYQNLLQLNDAGDAFRKALALSGDTDDGDIIGMSYWNLGLLELLRGDYISGFNHYRARFNPQRGWGKRLPTSAPVWRGEDVRGKKIIVAGEQGFGDVLMMARYLPLLKARGASVTLIADPALILFLRGWDGVDVVMDYPPERGDYQTSLFELPHYFGTALETIPADVPYLPAPEPDAQTTLSGNGKLKIGIVAAGRPEHGNDRRRSLPLAVFAPLFDGADAQFFNLTHHLKPEDGVLLARHNVTDLAPRIDNFRTSAQFVTQLDLVITCDTAMAHLAGGMGKKTWLLLPFAPEWRWLTEREDSPWYPSLRLFRQKTKGDWAEVIARVSAELENLIPALRP